MYIYHFWPLSMHCKKTTTIRCFLEATYVLLVVLRKPWIYTLCFDAHFSKFRDFWWFWTILIENGHFGPLLRTSNSLLSKSHDISAFNPKDPLRDSCFGPKMRSKSGQMTKIWGPGHGFVRLWAGPPAQRQLVGAQPQPPSRTLKGVQNGQNRVKFRVPQGPPRSIQAKGTNRHILARVQNLGSGGLKMGSK